MKKTYKSIKMFIVVLCIASVKLVAQPLSGLYTINSGAATGGTNFQTFTAFVTALTATTGVNGPVTVDVVVGSGPYNEQIQIPQVAGMSSTNKLTINGNGETIQFNSSNFSAPWTVNFNGLDYTTVNNLNIIGQGPTYAYAGILTGSSDYNVFNNCLFSTPQHGTSSQQVPFAIAGSNTSATTSGNGGQYNTINSCTVANGYYGVVNYGLTSAPYTQGNSFIGCRITDFYIYGFYGPYSKNLTIRNTTMDRMTRTSSSTCYGYYCYYAQGLMFEGNKIWKMYESNQGSFSSFYAVYNYGHPIANGLRNTYRNNIITDIKNNSTIYGFYIYSSASDVYNNTLDFDYAAGTSSSTMYGMYPYGNSGYSMTIRNNIITFRRGGSGNNRYGLYIPLTGNMDCDYNDIVMVAGSGNNNIGYYGGAWQSQAQWQTAGCDVHGFTVDPVYVSASDLHPTNVAMNNAALPLGLFFDYDAAVRNQVTPDIGALEFLTPQCVGTPTVGGINSPTFAICPGENVNASINNPDASNGITIQWQTSTISQVGPWTAVPGGTSVAYTVPNVTTTTWISPIITCTASAQNTSPVAQILVAGTTTNSVPYYEGFESIGINNRLPNCSWAASGLGTSCLTYSAAVANSGGYANTGSGFARFAAAATATNHFYTNGVQLFPGITYSAAAWYLTDYIGNTNFSDLRLSIGGAQTPTAQTSVVSSNGPASSASYKLISGTFTVASAGIYYLQISAASTGVNSPYLSFDDVSITAPCVLNSPVVSISANSSSICSGQSATLTATGASTYLWSNGATGSSIVVSPATSAVYSTIGTSQVGCTSPAVVQNITVKPTPAVSIIAASNKICEGASVNLSALGASTYTWANNSSNSTGITVSPAATTVYTLSGSNNGCTGTTTQMITVTPKPTVSIASSAASSTVCVGDVTTLTGSGANTFQWSSSNSFLQGNPVTVSPNANITYTATGTDANGCTNTSTIDFVVVTCVGINNITASLSGIKLYPNPNNGEFVVELNNGASNTVSVMDVNGKVILSNTTTDAKVNVNINKYAAGVYFVKIQTINATEVLKVVKQ